MTGAKERESNGREGENSGRAKKRPTTVIPKGTQWKLLMEVSMSEPQPALKGKERKDVSRGSTERYNFIYTLNLKASGSRPAFLKGRKGLKLGLWLTGTLESESARIRCVESGETSEGNNGPLWSASVAEVRLLTAGRLETKLVECFSEKGAIPLSPSDSDNGSISRMALSEEVADELDCIVRLKEHRLAEVALRLAKTTLSTSPSGVIQVKLAHRTGEEEKRAERGKESTATTNSTSGAVGRALPGASLSPPRRSSSNALSKKRDRMAKLEERLQSLSPEKTRTRPKRLPRRNESEHSQKTSNASVSSATSDSDKPVDDGSDDEEAPSKSGGEASDVNGSGFESSDSMDSDEVADDADDASTDVDASFAEAPEAEDLVASLEVDFSTAEEGKLHRVAKKKTARDDCSDVDMGEAPLIVKKGGAKKRQRTVEEAPEKERKLPVKKKRKIALDADDELDRLLGFSNSEEDDSSDDESRVQRKHLKKDQSLSTASRGSSLSAKNEKKDKVGTSRLPMEPILIESDEELELFLESNFKPTRRRMVEKEDQSSEEGDEEESARSKEAKREKNIGEANSDERPPRRRLRKLKGKEKAVTSKKRFVRRSLVFDSDEESEDSDSFSLPSRREDEDGDEDETLGGFIVDGSSSADSDNDPNGFGLPDTGPDDIIDSLLESSDEDSYDTDELLDSAMSKTDPTHRSKKKIRSLAPTASPRKALEKRRHQHQQAAQEDDQLYSNYMLSIPLHCSHPAHIVESTTLASARPPPLSYKADLPDCCVKKGEDSTLSSLQLETVRYVGQRHEQTLPDNSRAGYFCGDGTGVGKGREIASIIADNFLKGRKKSVWFTASTSLLRDAQRDLQDIGCGPRSDNHIRIFPIPEKVSTSIPYKTGTLLVTYTMLVAGGRPRYRYEQILEWLSDGASTGITPAYPWKKEKGGKKKKDSNGRNESKAPEPPRNDRYSFDGPILFDESHRSKNLNVKDLTKSSKTAQLVSLLQEQLPCARIVYVSATGASEPRHLGYMPRLGLWGPSTSFPNFEAFFKKVEKSGIGAMEMVAMEMKSLGMYCSRHLSFSGTEFDVVQLSMEPNHRKLYDSCTEWWNTVIHEYTYYYQNNYLPKGGDHTSKKIAMRLLWAAHQRFFLLMLVSLKQSKCTEIALKARKEGYAVVIGLFSTGEKSQEEQLAKHFDFDSLLSSPELMLVQFIEKWYPYCQLTQRGVQPAPNVLMKKNDLVSRAKALHLPENPLDKLIDTLGGVRKVAEMTGRTKRLVRKKGGTFELGTRVPSRDNNEECQAFMQGDKNLAVISEAASIGISLQASNTVPNRKRRMHIILQLPWSAEKAVQQLGRTHRSHQASAPLYKLLVTECGGEWRLAATIASRLAALGALTSGDRRAGAGAATLSQFTIVPRYGSKALLATEAFVKSQGIIGADDASDGDDDEAEKSVTALLSGVGSLEEPLCLDSSDEETPTQAQSTSAPGSVAVASDDLDKPMSGKEWAELYALMCSLNVFSAKNTTDKVKRFLNRLLGVTIRFQAHLFDRFIHYYDSAVDQAQQEGTYEDGVYDIEGSYANPLEERTLVYEDPRNYQQKTYRVDLRISRGINWDEAKKLLDQASLARIQREETMVSTSATFFPENGFYQHNRSFHIILAMQRDNRNYYHVVKPHIGHQGTPITRNDLKRHFHLMAMEDAHKTWTQKFLSNAESEGVGGGLMKRTILVGSILPTFDLLADELQVTIVNSEGKEIVKSELQVVRAHCPDPEDDNKKKKYVGILLPKNKVESTLKRLKERQEAGSQDLRQYDLDKALMHEGISFHPYKLEDLPLKKCQLYLRGEKDAPVIVEVMEEVKDFVREQEVKKRALEKEVYHRFKLNREQADISHKIEIRRYLIGDPAMSHARLLDCIEDRHRRDTSFLNVLYYVMKKHDKVMRQEDLEREVAHHTGGNTLPTLAGVSFYDFIKKYPTWLKKTGSSVVFTGGSVQLKMRNDEFPAIQGGLSLYAQQEEREANQRRQQEALGSSHPLATPPIASNAWTEYDGPGKQQQTQHMQKIQQQIQQHTQRLQEIQEQKKFQPQQQHHHHQQQQHQQRRLQQQPGQHKNAQYQEVKSQLHQQDMQRQLVASAANRAGLDLPGLQLPALRGYPAEFGATTILGSQPSPSSRTAHARVALPSVSAPPLRGTAPPRVHGWPLDTAPPPPVPSFNPRLRPSPVIVLSDDDD